MQAELTRAIVEEAQQACRYVAKHNTANMDAGDYRDGFETACEVCEDVIAVHVERHKERIEARLAEDLALRDAAAHGTGAMMGGKHVPIEKLIPDASTASDETSTGSVGYVNVLREALAFYAAGVGWAIAEDCGEKADAALVAQPDISQEVERAFLAVMNASDRELSLAISAWAERNLLKRRIAVAIAEVLRPQE